MGGNYNSTAGGVSPTRGEADRGDDGGDLRLLQGGDDVGDGDNDE